jgi:hypothetical protein
LGHKKKGKSKIMADYSVSKVSHLELRSKNIPGSFSVVEICATDSKGNKFVIDFFLEDSFGDSLDKCLTSLAVDLDWGLRVENE